VIVDLNYVGRHCSISDLVNKCDCGFEVSFMWHLGLDLTNVKMNVKSEDIKRVTDIFNNCLKVKATATKAWEDI